MKENWTNDIKQKLEGHQMAPPAGLWEGIGNEMGFPQKSSSKRWYWLAAAVVLALVGFFGIYQFQQDKSLPQVAQKSQTSETHITKETHIEKQQLAYADDGQHTTSKMAPKTSVRASSPTPIEVIQETSQEVIQVESQTEPQQTKEEEHKQIAENESKQTTTTSQQTLSEDYHHIAHHQNKQVSASSSASDWSIGLNASGGLLASADNNRTGRLYYPNAYAYQNGNAVSDISPYIETNYVSKHHLPVRFGLSLHYQLSPTLSLLSGINYTYLYSEFSIPLYQNLDFDQKLHYLGIPLGLSWQLLRSNGFSLYVSASAMLEKCLNEKPWQWSVNAAAGAEYAIIPQLGLYFEPSLGYFFNDGTSFKHYYKEHPFAPSIEFGIRLHISK
jgi:hypothetical protein